MENNEQYKTLIDMGCSPILCEAAIKSTKSQDIMALLDWISANEDKEDHWKEWLEQHKSQPEGGKEGELPRIPIETLINMEHCQQLQKLGHSKTVSEKALLLTNNMGVKLAQKWIEDHKYDLDFEEEVVVTGQQEEKQQLTPEEARQKLNELVAKARAVKKQREEEEALEREKHRMKSGKEMLEVKRIAEEQAAKRQLQLDRIQKAKDEAYKKQLVEQMRRERNQRLGIKEEAGPTVTASKKQEQKVVNQLEQVELQCEQVAVGNHAYPDKARTFFETANIYVKNIIKNNGEQKFRKINKENKAFQSRILEAFGGLQTLLAIGYQDEGSFLVMQRYDAGELSKISQVLQRYLARY